MSVFSSIFDIIGPVMVGPSSSHTAGAVRIGSMARQIMQGRPEEAEITFYGSFAHTYNGHGTDLAIISGLLGLATSSTQIRKAYELAEKAHMKVKIIASEELCEHPNTAKIVMKKGGRERSVIGVSLGGGMIEIRQVNEFNVHISGDNNVSLVFHQDHAGVIMNVSTELGKNDININQMEISRRHKGEAALMVLGTDTVLPEHCVDVINTMPYVENIIVLTSLSKEPEFVSESEENEEFVYEYVTNI